METIETADRGVEVESGIVEIEDTTIPLANSIQLTLTSLPPISPKNSIFRVPRKIRELNEKAYTPQMVSIGPLHHGNEDLKDMEEKKMRYLKAFLSRTTMSLQDCVKMVEGWEDKIKNCYAESIKLNSNEFIKMVLVDSSFVIESMIKPRSDDGWVLNNCIRMDLLLLENQLPFFVLEGIFNLAFVSNDPINIVLPSYLFVSLMYFKDLMLIMHIPENIQSSNVEHFVDLMRICHLPTFERSLAPGCAKYVRIQNATALHGSGVNFNVGSSKCLADIQYAKGVLGIPRLRIQDHAEAVLRNLIALELYLHPLNTYILDYIYFMDNLIDTTEDVDVLVKNGVLENWLGDNSAVAKLFNNLTTETWLWGDNFYFFGVSNDLNSYCRVPWHKWKAIFKREYFNTPWRIASIVAATILLVLTSIQTVCSLISV